MHSISIIYIFASSKHLKHNIMKKIELRNLHKGDYFHLKDDYDSPLWVRDTYDRSSKRFNVYKAGNVNSWSLRNGSLLIYVED